MSSPREVPAPWRLSAPGASRRCLHTPSEFTDPTPALRTAPDPRAGEGSPVTLNPKSRALSSSRDLQTSIHISHNSLSFLSPLVAQDGESPREFAGAGSGFYPPPSSSGLGRAGVPPPPGARGAPRGLAQRHWAEGEGTGGPTAALRGLELMAPRAGPRAFGEGGWVCCCCFWGRVPKGTTYPVWGCSTPRWGRPGSCR